MNYSLGIRTSDGRHIGIEWRSEPGPQGTAVQAFLRHDGELSADDLGRCLVRIGESERVLAAAERMRRTVPAHGCTLARPWPARL